MASKKLTFQQGALILGVLCCIFLIWLVFRGCDHVDPVSDNTKALDSLSKIIRDDKLIHEHRISIFKDQIDSLRLVINTNAVKSKMQEHQYDVVSWRLRYFIRKSDSLKNQLDTSSYVVNCDSIIREAIHLDSLSREYIALYNKTVDDFQTQSELKDSIIIHQRVAYDTLASRYNDLNVLATKINKDLQKSEKGRKFNRTLNRILAGVVLVLGGKVLIK